MYRIKEVDSSDRGTAVTLGALHRSTFSDAAPVPQFNSGHWWLAYQGATAVAFAGMLRSTHAANAGYFSRVGVAKAHIGRGLQLRLMRAAERRARRNGWGAIVSDTTDNVISANNFIISGYRLYHPETPWAWRHSLYWRKDLR